MTRRYCDRHSVLPSLGQRHSLSYEAPRVHSLGDFSALFGGAFARSARFLGSFRSRGSGCFGFWFFGRFNVELKLGGDVGMQLQRHFVLTGGLDRVLEHEQMTIDFAAKFLLQ